MEFNKTVILSSNIKDDEGNVFASMRTVLEGDGSTPVIMTMGNQKVVGFKDDGTPIVPKLQEDKLKVAQKELQAEAIRQQKELCIENGVDPELVNIINAERGKRN
ncbi:hypothetical protein [Lactobacillus taiwanensis]|uniref:hypothetical protein n=1 Tax=Lactobacillus taiwanensis TaxID=508451 RepID=UPI0032205212